MDNYEPNYTLTHHYTINSTTLLPSNTYLLLLVSTVFVSELLKNLQILKLPGNKTSLFFFLCPSQIWNSAPKPQILPKAQKLNSPHRCSNRLKLQYRVPLHCCQEAALFRLKLRFKALSETQITCLAIQLTGP